MVHGRTEIWWTFFLFSHKMIKMISGVVIIPSGITLPIVCRKRLSSSVFHMSGTFKTIGPGNPTWTSVPCVDDFDEIMWNLGYVISDKGERGRVKVEGWCV